MASVLLPIIAANADYAVGQALSLVAQGRMPGNRLAGVWQAYRTRGICLLFLEGDGGAFHADLQRSATCYLYYLRDVATEDEKVTSRAAPFFDAVACRDFEAARGIARHARATWHPEEEYEEDFLYVHFLLQRFFSEADEGTLRAVLEASGTLADDARLACCQALMDRDAPAFDRALGALILEREERYREGRAAGDIPEEEDATEGALFVEGLALVTLADHLGLAVQDNYLFIPSTARAPEPFPHNPNAWRTP